MKLNLRDYFSSIAFLGIWIYLNGLLKFIGTHKWELLGGGQIIIGILLMSWGLMFLYFLDDDPGLVDTLTENLLHRLKSPSI